MPETNENSHFVCAFLNNESFEIVHRKFLESFSDYLISFQLSTQQFRNHIKLNAVDLNRSIGCFDNGELVGLSLNGFGTWNNVPTVYDAGTGVIPSHRKRGISESMFRTMLPIFQDEGYKQCLLEVISNNVPAIKLYEKLGFERTRDLYLMQSSELNAEKESADGIGYRDIDSPDMLLLSSLGDGRPSWQNSPEAVERSILMKRVIGAFDGDECVGYIAFSAGVGRVAQIAVRPEFRRRGIGTQLLVRMHADTRPGYDLQVINIDAALSGAVEFFRSVGFEVVLTQHEMLKVL
ncbi:MAG: GNAT family N-acetyltransferase [Acidobacteriota bacterium]